MFFIESQRNIVFTFNDQPLELLLKKRLWRDLTILFSMENEKQMLQFPFLSMNCTLSRCTKFSVKVNFSSMYFKSNADQKYEISDFRKYHHVLESKEYLIKIKVSIIIFVFSFILRHCKTWEQTLWLFSWRFTLGSETISDNWKPFKNDKNVFLFHVKSFFLLEIFTLTFWLCRKTSG